MRFALDSWPHEPIAALGGWAGGLVLLGVAACSGDTPEPGFQNLGGDGPSGTSQASSTVTTATTAAHTASVTVASSTTVTVASSSSGSNCDDTGPGEPNETEQTALDLGGIGDCDGDGQSVSGVLNGTFDVDWYKFHGTDASAICSVDPARTLTASLPVRLCKFVQCDNAESNNFECPGGTTPTDSPDGRPGCCSMGGINFDLVCGGSQFNDENAEVFIRIDNPMASVCPSYTIDYHY